MPQKDEDLAHRLKSVDTTLEDVQQNTFILKDKDIIINRRVAYRNTRLTPSAGQTRGRQVKPPAFSYLVGLRDFLPTPSLRKKVGKLLGDQEQFIHELLHKRRYRAAKWQYWCTVGLMIGMTCGHPISEIAKMIRGKSVKTD
jgi:hypothetical protein